MKKEMVALPATTHNIAIDFDLLRHDESNKKPLDTSMMDRVDALLIYNGKVYADTNHQYAFKQALEDEGKIYHWDIENDITHESKAADETYKLSQNQNIYTFSVFNDGHTLYLIAHFENHLNDCLYLLEDYFEKGYILGSYIDMTANECYVFEKLTNLQP